MRPGDRCSECGAEGIQKVSTFGMRRYVCKNGCDERRLAKQRSENAKRQWDHVRSRKQGNG